MRTVILGPHIDLHPGIHGTLRDFPPEGFAYHQRGARHHFLMPSGGSEPSDLFPFEQAHGGEWVDFGPGPQLVHSARWPVLGRRAWVTDLDDFGYPLLLGRYAFHPIHDRRSGTLWTQELSRMARQRAAAMLRAYAQPSCKAILFRTHWALQEAARWIQALELGTDGQRFLSKCQVVYPTARPILPNLVHHKWREPKALQVLFVGGDFEVKNGRLALAVFQTLQAKHPRARFTYIGAVPEAFRVLTRDIDYQATLPREAVLHRMRDAHILFHPSRSESFGMVLVEAAAHGMAIVAAKGPGMHHMAELFEPLEATLLDRQGVAPEEEKEGFCTLLDSLLGDPDHSRRQALAAYASAAGGRLSLTQRNRTLQSIYEQALDSPAPQGVVLNELLRENQPTWYVRSSAQVQAAHQRFREREGITQVAFTLGNGLVQPAKAETSRPPTAGTHRWGEDRRPVSPTLETM